MRRSLLLLAALPCAASCVPAVEPPAPPAPAPVAAAPTVPPPPPLATDWRDWPVTPGTWRYARGDFGRSTATFGQGTNGGYLLQIACDARQRQVTLATTGAPGAPPLTVRTSTTVRTVPTVSMVHADGWPPVTRDIRLAATDPLLDAIAFSRGHFTIEEAGRPPLVIPAWPEIGRAIEDCRG